MAKLLYIESSPRKERSHSIAVASEFLSTYKQSHPGDRVETLDLWQAELPEFDGATIDAKYGMISGQTHTEAQKAAWAAIESIFNIFAAADKYVFSVPMWNFGIPYKLKHYIDLIVQPGLAFNFSADAGYVGLVTGKPAAIISASGGDYSNPPMSSMNMQTPYLAMVLQFIGFSDIKTIDVAPTLGAPDVVAAMEKSAIAKAQELAKVF